MATHYQVSAPISYASKEGEEKTNWVNCGVAFTDKSGDGMTVFLDAIPVPYYDKERKQMRYKLRLSPPRNTGDGNNGQSSHNRYPDEPPF